MRRWAALAIALVMLALTACSPHELEAWVQWHDTDPAAAEEFARQPDVAADLATGEHESSNHSTIRNDHADRWEAIAWCESGRQWGLRATNRTGTYGGGLMIRDNVWRAYGGGEFAGTADQASKAEQIEVAERILDDVGWGAWDCA